MMHNQSFNEFNTYIKLFSGDIENRIVEFLLSNESEIGWGEYKGAPFNIKISAIVVSSLNHCPYEKSDWIINKVLGIKKELLKESLANLKVQELGCLYDIISLDDNSDELKQNIRKELVARLTEKAKTYSSLATLLVNVSALIKAEAIQEPILQYCVDNILELQQKNGAWGKEENPKIILSNTSKALIILNKLSKNEPIKYEESITKGIEFLSDFIDAKEANILGEELGFYQLMILIKAITINEIELNATIDKIITYLIKNLNSDGGIGTLPNQPSNNEITALLLYTFHHIGYFKYIPLRIANSKVIKLIKDNSRFKSEFSVLKKEFDIAVKKEVNHVIDEKNELSAKLQESEKRNKEISRRVQRDIDVYKKSIEYDFLSKQKFHSTSETNNFSRYQIFGTFLSSFNSIVFVILYYLNTNKIYLYIGIGSISLTVLYLGILYLIQYRRKSDSILKTFSISNNQLDSLSFYRHKFIDISSDLPPSAREELIYRLSREFGRMPKDVLPRYLEDLSMSLDLPLNKRRELYFWLEDLNQRDEVEIKIIFDQLRRFN
jgi:hypothetical protein